MADDVEFQSAAAATPAAATIVAADEIGGKKHQRVKVQHGADGSATDVSSASPMPTVDNAVATALASLLTELGQKLETGGEVALSAASLSALETIQVGNFPADPATQTTLAAILAKIIAAPATEAKQDTLIGHVDTLETLLGDIRTAAQLLDNAISGNEMQVDVVGALPAGSNEIGSVGLNAAALAALETIGLDSATLTALETITIGTALPAGTNNIGDVDVLTLPAIPAGTNNIGDVDVASVPGASSATVTQVASSTSSTTLQASNSSRKGLSVFNDSTAVLYLKYGSGASTSSYTVKMAAGAHWEMPPLSLYTGLVAGIWASANGNVLVTEL